MPTEIQIEDVENPDDDLREAVNFQLRTHNQMSSPVFWEEREKEKNQPRPITLFAYAEDGAVIGGLFAKTEFSWLKIDIMATVKELRGSGVGTALLARAEEIAKERGCKDAYTDTMEFQAPGFYQKAGYRIKGEFEDWDSHGNKKFLFAKDLA